MFSLYRSVLVKSFGVLFVIKGLYIIASSSLSWSDVQDFFNRPFCLRTKRQDRRNRRENTKCHAVRFIQPRLPFWSFRNRFRPASFYCKAVYPRNSVSTILWGRKIRHLYSYVWSKTVDLIYKCRGVLFSNVFLIFCEYRRPMCRRKIEYECDVCWPIFVSKQWF